MDLILADILSNLYKWEVAIVSALVVVSTVATVLFSLLGKKKWKAKATEATEKLMELDHHLKDKLPEEEHKKVVGSLDDLKKILS